jgi:CARDB
MRFRPAHIVLVACTALALALAPAASAKSVASVRVTECQSGAKSSQRSATFHAQMSAVPGTSRMSMRFVLLEKKPGSGNAPFTRAPLRSLPWHWSRRGVKHFGFSQKITKLQPGSSYRVRVQFRWSDASGHELLRTHRTSDACVQPGLPNLRVTSVTISPGSSAAVRTYKVTVDNAGQSAARRFTVALFVDGALVDTAKIDRLDSQASRTVTFSGQPCQRLRAVADYGHSVRETNEHDNALSATC